MGTTIEEDFLCLCWIFTDTTDGCMVALDILRDLEKEAKTVFAADLYKDAIDLVFAKGNMMRLVENQISFVGELK